MGTSSSMILGFCQGPWALDWDSTGAEQGFGFGAMLDDTDNKNTGELFKRICTDPPTPIGPILNDGMRPQSLL